MAEVLSAPASVPAHEVCHNPHFPVPSMLTTAQDSSKYVYFHSGSGATYRKVSEKPTFTSIPTIDIADIDGTLEQRQAIAREVKEAASNVGFFYVANTGIPDIVLTDVFNLLKRFFALDHETKMTAHVQKNPAIRGYEPMMETRLDPRTKGGKSTSERWDAPLTDAHTPSLLSPWATTIWSQSRDTPKKPARHHQLM
jgi:hypothetical protein